MGSQIKSNQIDDGTVDTVDLKNLAVTDAKINDVDEKKFTYNSKIKTKFYPWSAFTRSGTVPHIVTWNTNQQAYGLDYMSDEFVYGALMVPEDASTAGSVTLDMIWCPPITPSNENVVLNLDSSIAAEGVAFPASSNNQQTAPCGTTRYKYIGTAFGAFTGRSARDLISVRVGRLAGSSSSDTYNYDIAFLGIRMRYTSDRRGT